MRVLGIIPSRYASTRFPGKPLVVIEGKSMIRRVYEQASSCQGLTELVVATDHETIFQHVREFGGKVLMTASHHRSGTERCHEAMSRLSEEGLNFDVIINIQGDEPFIRPEQISELIGCFRIPEVTIASQMRKIDSSEDLHNPDVVKVITDIFGDALYFSRAAVPYIRENNNKELTSHITFYRHIGIYGYRPGVLDQIVQLDQAPLEQAESLEQLRWLANGFRIRMMETSFDSISVDSPADLLKLTNRG